MGDQKRVDFDAYARGYREEVARSIDFSAADPEFFTRVKVRELLALARRRVGAPAELSFLDVGCGPGETDRFLAGQVGALAGIDVSAAMVEAASARNPAVDYRLANSDGPLPFEAATFDVCFAICVLHHVEPSARSDLVGEMARVVKPGGLVALFEHNPLNPLTRRAVAGCEFDRDAVLLNRREAQRLLWEAKLDQPQHAYIVYFTRDSPRRRRIEHLFRRFPLGAQYVVSALRAESMS